MGKSGCFPQGKPAATESHYPTLINYKVHAYKAHDNSYACIYTQGLGMTPTASQHIFDSEKLTIFFFVLLGFEPQVFGS